MDAASGSLQPLQLFCFLDVANKQLALSARLIHKNRKFVRTGDLMKRF